MNLQQTGAHGQRRIPSRPPTGYESNPTTSPTHTWPSPAFATRPCAQATLRAGDSAFLITRNGELVCYCADIEEVSEELAHLGLELADLTGPDQAAHNAG